MNCQEFWSFLSKPPGSEFDPAAELRAHTLECPLCAAHLARQRELTAGLRRVAENLSGVKAPPRVEARLLKAFRAHGGVPARADSPRWLAAAWAAAAVMVLAAGLFLAGGAQRALRPAPSARTPPVIELASWEARSTVNGDEAGPETEGFIPLPNAERIGPNDDFNLVRVEVPRSAMMAVGIAVSADRASERVEADVLLGSDGLARAVRFLE